MAAALASSAIGIVAALLGWRSAIAPVAPSNARVYTAETIEQGRLLAAAGNCVGCHTAPGGAPNAGGRGIETPFGIVYATNITPDAATGIGGWSSAAFQRAMREGISRDGRHLYPAFPYTAYTRATDADLTALYAWLMAQPPVVSPTPATRLAFPFSVRPLMSAWNAMFLSPGPVDAVPSRSAEWNRGAYLVDGFGHCGSCHSERNALGAEKAGRGYLAGAMVDGWEAPALTSLGRAPVPWTEQQLFDYLRFGHASQHGSASGPMAPVVQQLAPLPDADVRAMAIYLASFNEPRADAPQPAALVARSAAVAAAAPNPSQRMFETACGACHHDGDGPQLLGQNIPLALNTNLHSDRPDNLLRVILEGIREPATPEIGFMPSFRDHLDDAQIAALASHLRQRFAPDAPPWRDLEAAVPRVRAAAH